MDGRRSDRRGGALVRDIVSQLRLGRLLYNTYHAPRGLARRVWQHGGMNLLLARAGEFEMQRAARTLPPAPTPAPDAPEVFYLTGRRYAHQTAFCAWSLCAATGWAPRTVIVDDGSLERVHLDFLCRVLPGTRLVTTDAVDAALQRRLPASRFPALRYRRRVYPHIRKLTDVHAFGGGWKLVLDSDMLFHAHPTFLLEWLAHPTQPCHMQDVADAYGYSGPLLCELAGGELPARVNVGLCGLCSDEMPWHTIEDWCETLIAREGSHYLMEQALVAMLCVGRPHTVAPPTAYVVQPTREETRSPTAVLHHYTDAAKAWYFRYGWRQATATTGGSDAPAQDGVSAGARAGEAPKLTVVG